MPEPAPGRGVILIHGLWASGHEMALLGRRLRAAGLAPRRLRYHVRGRRLAVVARRLRAQIEAEPQPPHLLAHSLGGLLLLEAVRGLAPGRLGRIVLLGCPVAGSAAAAALARRPWGRILLGRALGWGLLHPAPVGDPGVPVLSIAGDRPSACSPGRWLLRGARLPRPNDGVVAVRETRPPWPHSARVFPVSHIGLLVSAAVAAEVAGFLADPGGRPPGRT